MPGSDQSVRYARAPDSRWCADRLCCRGLHVLQRVAAGGGVLRCAQTVDGAWVACFTMCCVELQRVAVGCSMLQWIAVYCGAFSWCAPVAQLFGGVGCVCVQAASACSYVHRQANERAVVRIVSSRAHVPEKE